jgi:hypothetical protein
MTQQLRLVDQKLSVIVLRNWYHLQGRNTSIQIAERLANVVLDGAPAVKDPPSTAQRKQLVGTYQLDKAKATFTATVVDGKDGLTLRLTNEEPWALVPAGPLRFALLGIGEGVFAAFALDGDKVKTLTLELPKGPPLVFQPVTGPAYSLKDFDKEAADKVAGKVWLGELPVTPGGKDVLRIAFRFTVRDGLLTGVLDNPDQGMTGVELLDLRLEREGIAFAWPQVGASYEGTLSADAKEIAGHWKQGGIKTPLRFTIVSQ